MYVKCIGSGDAFSSGGKFQISFFIRTKMTGILLDCGATTLTGLRRENLSADDIDAILITHLHGDHFGGLAFILCEIAALGKRQKTLTILGPRETEKRTRQNLACLYPGTELTDEGPVRFIHYVEGETQELRDLRITAYSVIHSPETNPHAFRIEAGKRIIAYSGDTEWTDNLLKASDGADLFICEASGYRTPMKNHLTVSRILQEQALIRVKRIVLTHAGEHVLRHVNDIPLKVVEDGEILMNDDS